MQRCSVCGQKFLDSATSCPVHGDTLGAVEADAMIGCQIGDATIEELIAVGGFGRLYRAQDPIAEREVAIKILHPEHSREPGFKARFRSESKIVTQLSHPNIVQVYDFGKAVTGELYITMELLYGEDLKQRFELGPALTANEIARFCLQTLSALETAHAASIVHRDLKPGNVFITRSGDIKLIDFGLAKGFGDTAADATRITATGMAVGTPGFMAPELLVGANADPRSDIYAFGVLLYKACSGKHPFFEGHLVQLDQLHKRQLNTPAPYLQLDDWRGIPPKIADIVDRCLERHPRERFQTAQALLSAIKPLFG